MKRLAQEIWLAVMLAVSAAGHAALWDEAYYEREKKSINDAMDATKWVIENGITIYYREGGEAGGEDGFKDVFSERWSYKEYYVSSAGGGMPEVDSERHLARFKVSAFNSVYRIINLYRETLPGGIYEFWLVLVIRTHHKSSDTNRSMFYVTRADEVRGQREILHESDRFIERYEVAPGTYFDFPVDDMEVLWKMDAWRYPESYPDSDLKNLKVGKHWRTGRITVERGDGEEWAYQEKVAMDRQFLYETIQKFKRGIRAGVTFSEEDWEAFYNGLVGIINLSGRPIREKDWKKYYKRLFDKLERLDKTAAKDRFDAKEQLNIAWEDKK
ncbi:MAG: hypothetical protein OXS28_14620 [Gammaproteobacteria bacterium]|nr:hypothetical protein [Gammaproteobacteria bacterium]